MACGERPQTNRVWDSYLQVATFMHIVIYYVLSTITITKILKIIVQSITITKTQANNYTITITITETQNNYFYNTTFYIYTCDL